MIGRNSRRAIVGLIALSAALGLGLAAYRFGPGLLASPLDRAGSAYDRGDYREARTLSLAILTGEPEDRGAMRIMARASARLGNDDTAQSLYGRIGESSMEAEDFFALGAILERQGQGPAALAVLDRGRKLGGPVSPEAWHALARLHAREGQLPEAIDAAENLARAPGWEARGSLILGVLDVEDANPSAAAPALDRALRADPKLSGGITSPIEAVKLLAGALLRTSRPGEALSALEPIIALSSRGDEEASWLYSRAFLQLRDVDRARAHLPASGWPGHDDPTRPDPAPYVGATACAGCHATIYQAQRTSRHSRTYSGAADLGQLALPAGPVPDKNLPGTSHSLAREGQAIRLTTRAGDKELTALIAFAVGSGDRGLTMVARDEKGLARVCRVSSYLGGATWDLTSNADDPHADDPGGPLGRPMAKGAEQKCVACHVTSLRAARDRKAPEAADRGIGCERCHGPGGNHLVAVALKFPDPAIARPSRASAEQITKLCGACHKADDPSTKDTDPRFVRFQATTLPLSRCYLEGQGEMSCVTCHDPHRDANTTPAHYEARCLACHKPGEASTPPSIATRAMRRVPCPVNPASGCVDCHMPKVAGAAPHALFTDHQIRVHKPVGEAKAALSGLTLPPPVRGAGSSP